MPRPYKYDYEFQDDLRALFVQLNDAHTQVRLALTRTRTNQPTNQPTIDQSSTTRHCAIEPCRLRNRSDPYRTFRMVNKWWRCRPSSTRTSSTTTSEPTTSTSPATKEYAYLAIMMPATRALNRGGSRASAYACRPSSRPSMDNQRCSTSSRTPTTRWACARTSALASTTP